MLVSLVLAYVMTIGRLAQTGFFDWGPRRGHPEISDEAATTMTWCLAWLVGNIPLVFPVMGLAGAQLMQVCAHCVQAPRVPSPATCIRALLPGVSEPALRSTTYHIPYLLLLFKPQASQNMTTNELQNWPRYKHFRKGEGRMGTQFTNPFDKGFLKNCHETCFPDEYPVLPGFIETQDMERVRKELEKLPVSNAGASGSREAPTTV